MPRYTALRNRKRSNKNGDLFLAYGALTVVTLIWALAGPVIKLTLQEVPPMHFLFFRLLIVCVILLPSLSFQLKKDPIKSKEIPTLIILGLLSQSSLALVFMGYKYTTALDAAIITLLSPLLAVAAGHYYFNEKVGVKTKMGIAVASIGTFLIIIEPFLMDGATLKTKELKVLGNILILTATLAFLVFTLWSKYAEGEKSAKIKRIFKLLQLHKLKKGRSPITITFITFYVGLASSIPLLILETKGYLGPTNFSIYSLQTGAIMGILYMAIFSSIIAYTLYEWSLKIASVADTAFFNYLSPVFTLPFAYLLLSEIPTKINLIGAGIIGIGVLIAEQKKS